MTTDKRGLDLSPAERIAIGYEREEGGDTDRAERGWEETRMGRKLVEAEVALFEGNEAVVADDEVVEDVDSEELAGFDNFAGDTNVFG